MPITKNSDRQYELCAIVDFTFADLADSTAENAIELPSDCIVTGGHIYISEAFDSTTSDSIVIGDTDDPDEYLGATSIAATGLTALVPTGVKLAAGKSITMTHTAGVADTATAGIGQLVVYYVRQGRSNENQG